MIPDTTYVGRLTAKKEYLDLRYQQGLKSNGWYTKRAPDGELRPFQYDLEVKGSSRHPGASIEFEMNTIMGTFFLTPRSDQTSSCAWFDTQLDEGGHHAERDLQIRPSSQRWQSWWRVLVSPGWGSRESVQFHLGAS